MRRGSMPLVALLAVSLMAAACSKAPNDNALATQIKAQMFSDPQLKNADLNVTVSHGQVTLAGNVPNDTARLDAYKLASQTPGVSKVIDQMTVQEAAATPPVDAAPQPAPAPEPVRATAPKPRRHHAASTETPMSAHAAPAAPSETPAQPGATTPPPPPPPQPKRVEFPVGTTVTIRTVDPIDSSVNHAGEVFHAALEVPLVQGDQVVVPKGTDIYVKLVNASSAGHMAGRSELSLELVKMDFHGQSYTLATNTYMLQGGSRGKNTAEKVGAGAAIGAIIGGIVGGGKGAAIGAGVGGGSGGVYQGVTKGQQVKVPSETKLDFQLQAPLDVSYMPRSSSAQ